ncbi:MAG TPA: hypothetical protein VFF67_04605 [Thermoplasmata archaeon]|nr:hypothetical protein [Thermoplasmata archaeon]
MGRRRGRTLLGGDRRSAYARVHSSRGPRVAVAIGVVAFLVVSGVLLFGPPSAATSRVTACRPHVPCHGAFTAVPRSPLPRSERAFAASSGPTPTGLGRDAVLATENLVNSTFTPGPSVTPDGIGPSGIAYDASTHTFWIADSTSNSVSVVSSSLTTIVATIPVGAFPYALAYAANVHEVFVSNYDSNTVSVLNDTSFATVATIPIGETRGTSASGPAGIAYDPVTGGVFVASWGHYIIPCCVYNLTEINPATDLVEKTIQAGAGTYNVAFDPYTGLLYTTEYDAGTAAVVNGSTGSVTTVAGAGLLTLGVVIDSSTHEFAVLGYNQSTTAVRLYYESNDSLDRSYTVWAAAPNLGGSTYDPTMDAFLIAGGGSVLAVVRPSDGTIVANVSAGSCLEAVAYIASGPLLSAVDLCTNRVVALSPSTATEVRAVQLGAGPRSLAVDPSTGELYVADRSSSALAWVDGTTLSPSPELTLGLGTSAVAFDPSLRELFVVCTGVDGFSGSSVQVFSDLTHARVATIPMPSVGMGALAANGIAYDPETGYIDVLRITSIGYYDSTLNVTEINPGTNAIAGNFTVVNFTGGSNPAPLARAAIVPIGNGGTLAVADPWDGLVLGVNASTGARAWTRPMGGDPNGLFVNPTNGRLDVIDPAFPRIAELNGATGAFADNITTIDPAYAITFDPRNDRLYVAENAAGTVTGFVEALNASTLASVETVSVPTAPWAIAYLPTSGTVAICGPPAGAVYLLGQALTAGWVNSSTPLVQGEPIRLNASARGGYEPVRWNWTGLPPGCASSAGPVVNCTPGVSGKFTVLANATDRANESSIGTLTLSIAPYPLSASISVAPATGPYVNATPIDLAAELAAGEAAQVGSGLRLNWTVSPSSSTIGFNRTTGANVSVTFGLVGNYTITLTASFNGTRNLSHLALQVVPPPPPRSPPGSSSTSLSGLLSGPWLYLLVALIAVAAIAGVLLARRRRPPGSPRIEESSAEEYVEPEARPDDDPAP